MSCSLYEHFEADYLEDNDWVRNYECTIIKEANLARTCFLLHNILEYHPTDDIYTEVRYMRANDHTLRVVDPQVTSQGHVDKGGGKFTARLAVYRDPWFVRPHADTTVLKVTGEQISDIGTSGVALMDFSDSTIIAVEYAPAETEIIELGGGTGGLSAEQDAKLTAIFNKTEQMAFTNANELDTNVKSMNDSTVNGSGIESDLWRG